MVYLVNGISPGPLIEASQGEMFSVTVFNELPTEVTMHWYYPFFNVRTRPLELTEHDT